jgi:uncharacterized protein (DUF1330 family)
MPSYLLFMREKALWDDAEMEEYRRRLKANPPESSKLTPLVLNGVTESLEGAPAPEAIVIFQFPTAADAKAWYNSPAYQEALQHRLRAGAFRVMIVEGISQEAFLAEIQAPD